MSAHTFSLFHHTAPPKTGAKKPPLLMLLHGYGANEDDLFSLVPYLDERFLVVSARAPIRLRGMGGYAWFNLGFTPEGIAVDPAEVESARQTLKRFIDEVVAAYDCDPDAVYLVGFSQGAMMSLAVALTHPGTAAVVAMSGRLMPQTIHQIQDKDALIGLPIFVVHGTRDTVLPISHGRETRAALSELPVDLTYREYAMGHEISAESLEDITEWLKARLDKASTVFIN